MVPQPQVIDNREKERMSKADVYRLWDGRIDSLLTVWLFIGAHQQVDRRTLQQLQKEAVLE